MSTTSLVLRPCRASASAVRFYSKKPSPKSRVLEKPTKFVPPSHPSRLVNPKKQWIPPLPQREVEAQKARSYPNTLPPPNTWSHWIIHHKSLHFMITMTVLSALALYTWLERDKEAPYSHMRPPLTMLFTNPIQFYNLNFEVLKLNTQHRSMEVGRNRKRDADDAEKIKEYRKAHGLPQGGSLGSWFNRGKITKEGDAEADTTAADQEKQDKVPPEAEEGGQQPKRRPVKMWFGIW
ncbi:MAG: hypothetical protein M1814_006558 [Vezdaea aestivalis]|nr:MAG: hypothetical protein M1814_006558 [Vezdaea aestivalis]